MLVAACLLLLSAEFLSTLNITFKHSFRCATNSESHIISRLLVYSNSFSDRLLVLHLMLVDINISHLSAPLLYVLLYKIFREYELGLNNRVLL